MRPIGFAEVAWATALCTIEKSILCAAIASGSTCTRTANFGPPNTDTWATPDRVDRRCAMVVSAYSSTSAKDRVRELTDRTSTGASDGLTLRNEGGVVISGGSLRCARLSAD